MNDPIELGKASLWLNPEVSTLSMSFTQVTKLSLPGADGKHVANNQMTSRIKQNITNAPLVNIAIGLRKPLKTIWRRGTGVIFKGSCGVPDY
jgi:hypothetical protein